MKTKYWERLGGGFLFIWCMLGGYSMMFLGFIMAQILEAVKEKPWIFTGIMPGIAVAVGFHAGVLFLVGLWVSVAYCEYAWEFLLRALGYYQIEKKWVLEELPVPKRKIYSGVQELEVRRYG